MVLFMYIEKVFCMEGKGSLPSTWSLTISNSGLIQQGIQRLDLVPKCQPGLVLPLWTPFEAVDKVQNFVVGLL